jgi:hypothetical protein
MGTLMNDSRRRDVDAFEPGESETLREVHILEVHEVPIVKATDESKA